MSWQEQLRQLWDQMAGWWDQDDQSPWHQTMRAGILPFFQDATGLVAGSRVLDAGCGSGQDSLRLAAAGYQVTGVDLSPAMLERARQQSAAQQLDVTFRTGELEQLPVPDAAFDAVLCVTALEFAEVPTRALAEFHRSLVPGGWLVTAILGPQAAPRQQAFRRLGGEVVPMNTMQPWELVRLLSRAGWVVTRQQGLYADEVPPAAVAALQEQCPSRLPGIADLWLVAAHRSREQG